MYKAWLSSFQTNDSINTEYVQCRSLAKKNIMHHITMSRQKRRGKAWLVVISKEDKLPTDYDFNLQCT